MSGLAGIVFSTERHAQPADLAPLLDNIDYRGPDGADIALAGNAALGHVMLHSTPQAYYEKLPWAEPGSGLVITCDVRLDNRSELWESLKELPAHYRHQDLKKVPDSQLIVHAYRQWGERCVDHLLGDFAFAIWDQGNQVLFCARDPMGIKPFVYHYSPAQFTFASAATAIARAGGVRTALNPGRVADYLEGWLEGINKTETFFTDIHRLPPAHTLTLKNAAISLRCYWSPDPTTELKLGSDADYEQAFAEVFEKAVSRRLQGGDSVGAMLSGGVDSSTIVGVARNISREKRLLTVSAVSDDLQACREYQHIQQVLQAGGLDNLTLSPANMEAMRGQISTALSRLEDPNDGLLMLATVVYLQARTKGCVSVLDGVDGDQIASVAPTYPSHLLRQGQLSSAAIESFGLSRNFYTQRSVASVFGQSLRTALIPNVLRKFRSACSRPTQFNRLLRNSDLNEQFAREIDLPARAAEMASQFTAGFPDTIREGHYRRLMPAYLTVAIERYERVAACCGVEHRKPLLDREVVEFCLSLPWEQKVRNGWSKYSLRRLAETVVPKAVAWRRGKEHVGWDFTTQWVAMHRQQNVKFLNREGGRLEPFFNMQYFQHYLQEYESGSNDYTDEIGSLVTLIQWLQRNGF
ncbi:hypothetical protein EYC98_07830 [Halieaceae bacterium IMCC14734]|uniref:asparagine synthase (glutamine-hydrolyzing) n=1 Tax=Candidatus Litorirhabdus singularis TaxID=2518993 RepID=A0ABT3TEP4_9GAMM|nr:asparagine synthase-related protein [Candidatus Litorirhabdus singularis]MCX2980785.1 hypothetical protein [Candidatus Litorirhabdus singularis]